MEKQGGEGFHFEVLKMGPAEVGGPLSLELSCLSIHLQRHQAPLRKHLRVVACLCAVRFGMVPEVPKELPKPLEVGGMAEVVRLLHRE